MDGLNNNNNINNYDLNYGNTFLFGDDLRNHNESRTTARVTPLTSTPYTSQECQRISMDRMKDRQIEILRQKNNQLQMDVLAMQYRTSNTFPMMNDYGIYEQYGMNNIHLQLKLLTTALDEKSEELKQAKEEHDLIMEERLTVHKELRDQAAEIDRLKRQNYYLREQLRGSNSGLIEVSKNVNEEWSSQMRELGKENDNLKTELASVQRTVHDLTDEKERTCQQLDTVVNQYYYLKKNVKQKRHIAEQKLQQFTDEKCEILTETVKVTDLKMDLLNIVIDISGDISDNNNDNNSNNYGDDNNNRGSEYVKQSEDIKSMILSTLDGRPTEHKDLFHLRCDDKLLDIDGVDVSGWTEEQIFQQLSRYGSGKYIQVILSRPCARSGTFYSWTAAMKLSSVETLGLSPLWLVTKGDSVNFKDHINAGDILQVRDANDGADSLSVVRLLPSPFVIACDNVDRKKRCESDECRNESTPVYVKPNIFFPPVLPKKRRSTSADCDPHPKSLDRLMSTPNTRHGETHLSNMSRASVVSAPPIPPRSSTSLQCSFIENNEMSCTSNLDYSELLFNDDSASDKLKMSVHSAFARTGELEGSLLNSEIMSASFSGSSDFVSTKMPKLGKCRNVVLNIPSQVFNLKQLGLHLLHTKNDQYPSSKSDVDVSVVNQIFIRNIESNSCARQAGLIEGDEIISINNQPVSRMTSDEAEHSLMTSLQKQQNLRKEQKKIPLIIKVQFNPLKMFELSKDSLCSPVDSSTRFTPLTCSMYEESRSGSYGHDKWNSHRLHVIRSSSNLNISESPDKSINIFDHLLTKTRTVRINMCTVLSQIKIMGGSAIGIFISNIEYRDKESETIDKDSIGNRLALGDKIVDINGESYERAIGEDAITSLNRFGHQVTLTVLYEPSGLLSINSDPLCQEHFYMEAMFSFSEIDGKLSSTSSKVEKSTSYSTRLDNFGFSVYFIKGYHLNFERGDILLVDATILPASMTRRQQDNYLGCDWHASVVDRSNTKVRSGMIPSALWLQKMISAPSKTPLHRGGADKNSRCSMRSTPSSPKSDINTFLSSNSTHIVSQPCTRHTRHSSSLSQKLFRRFSIRNSFHSTTTTSVDETNRKASFSKEVAFAPLRRVQRDSAGHRPVVLLGPHSETISMILASKMASAFVLSTLQKTVESRGGTGPRQIISPVSTTAILELQKEKIYPIVLLLKYKSAKEIRQLKIGKSTQITMNKSESFRLHGQIKDLETSHSHLIDGHVCPSSMGEDNCQEMVDAIDRVGGEDVWLRVDRYQYSG